MCEHWRNAVFAHWYITKNFLKELPVSLKIFLDSGLEIKFSSLFQSM